MFKMDLFNVVVFVFHLMLFFIQVTTSSDTLTASNHLSDNQKLVSSSGRFELGFFSSPVDNQNRFLGIWYKGDPQTVVWVGNRNKPILDQSGVLQISANNNLVLVDKNGSVLWSSNSTISARNPVAQLLDSGNLVVRDADEGDSQNYQWQSFDHPTDTLLPGMKLGWDLKTGLNRVLTSWKSSDDPSVGEYTCGIELQGLPQLVIRFGGKKSLRIGEWYGDRFSGRHKVDGNLLFDVSFVYNSTDTYFVYKQVDPAILVRTVLDDQGIFRGRQWDDRNHWDTSFELEKDRCDTYNLCGPNSKCDPILPHLCECLTGFTPKSPDDWNAFNTDQGCVLAVPLDCKAGEGFVEINGVKLPDIVDLRVELSMTDCQSECLRSCSCTACAHSNSTGNGRGCLFWSGNLLDIRSAYMDYGQTVYVRLSASAMESLKKATRRRRRLEVVIAVFVSFVVVLLIVSFSCYMINNKRKASLRGRFHTQEIGDGDDDLPTFDLAAVAVATQNFFIGNKIGEGGFGPVYKGVLPSGQEIAVKRLSVNSGQGMNELKNELILISKLQHRNLVRLLGCCIQDEERILIYEHMVNRSLDLYIFDKAKRKTLGWSKRYQIILGIARGLVYLHRDSRLRIIHRDLKASNILLDGNMEPKISDFGLARMFGGEQTTGKTNLVVGTYGYMSPEYALDGLFSIKSDVFSFGVLLLEIISGQSNRRFCHPDHDFNLLGHAWKYWNEGRVLEILDTSVEGQFQGDEAARVVQIGLLCVQKLPESRPAMSAVVMMLENQNAELPEPKLPGFFTERNLNENDSSSRDQNINATNELTITTLQGR